MRRNTRLLAAVAVIVAVTVAGGVVAKSSARQASPEAQESPARTAMVARGRLSAMVSQYGTLTYRARLDGSPYGVINRARGIYTDLPGEGDKVGCGDVLYRVDDDPVLLLCGTTPAYRSLSEGASGHDVTELEANLVHLGYATRAQLEPSAGSFDSRTAASLERLQSRLGLARTGTLELGRAVFLPGPVRVARVAGELGGSARPGAQVMRATSGALEVQIALDPSQQDDVKRGDLARIILPGNDSVSGRVERVGRVAQVSDGQSAGAGATIPAYISLTDPARARGLDRAPVRVEITTRGVESALSVPVTAIVGTAGSEFAVEVVRLGGRRELVAVKLGLFDTAGGRVQVVEGELRVGDHVVVPTP